MLSLPTARALSQAGLAWAPAQLDVFAIPDRGMDDRAFVITDMPAALARLHGQTIVTFEGAMEWALDFVNAGEVVWLPTEEQLRTLLSDRLAGRASARLSLHATPGGCRCEIQLDADRLIFEAANGSEAYAAALLRLLQHPGAE